MTYSKQRTYNTDFRHNLNPQTNLKEGRPNEFRDLEVLPYKITKHSQTF